MFKILSFLIGVVIAIMFFAPGLYFDVFASIKGVEVGNSTAEQIGYGLVSLIGTDMIVSEHLPYWIFAFVGSVICAIMFSPSDVEISKESIENIKIDSNKSTDILLQELVVEVQQLRKELSK